MGVPEALLPRVFELLRKASGVDFSDYKRATIQRRMQRRMTLHKLESAERYLQLLERDHDEVLGLYRDILIHVTHFFREPESFAALKEIVFPRLVDERGPDQPVRIWVPGCSTGEEAYSLAIALLEHLGTSAATLPIQIFATDISDGAIERARSGTYPKTIEADVSPERLKRFFTAQDGGYRVIQPVRDLCVFARQDLTRDPPFSRLDLIVCRNVLIYLGPSLQKRLMGVFHYALKPHGFLMLGQAESIGPHAQYFASERKHKIYRKRVGTTSERAELPAGVLARGTRTTAASAPDTFGVSVEELADRRVLEQYGPPGVLIDDHMMIVQTRGDVDAFLALPRGVASLNVLKMARDGLVYAIRSAHQEARKSKHSVLRSGVSLKAATGEQHVDVRVLPVESPGEAPHFLVLFETPRIPEGRRRSETPGEPGPTEERLLEAERELETTREHMQAMIQDMEAANEELQSANEEILSSNEELQSTNEELDTAREELQSTNEEINTINEELQARNEELVRVNSDLVNLLGSVRIAIVIVGRDLSIRRFTPMAEKVLNLIASDVGRPIGHIKPNIDCPDLEALIQEVIESVTPLERQVHDAQGVWYLLKIRPYKDLENRIDGAVLALFDVDQSRRETGSQESRDLASVILHAVDQPLAVLDSQGRLASANRAFLEGCGLEEAADSREQSLQDVLEGKVPAPRVAEWVAMVQRDGATPPPLDLPDPHHPGRIVRIVASPVRRSGLGLRHVLRLTTALSERGPA